MRAESSEARSGCGLRAVCFVFNALLIVYFPLKARLLKEGSFRWAIVPCADQPLEFHFAGAAGFYFY